MEIIYSFSRNKYKYDCAECCGICCNICGELLITKKQLISNEFKFYWDYCKKNGENYKITIPKKCWFLKNNACKLGEQKPIPCKLYPVEVYKLYDKLIIAELNPCPYIKISNNEIDFGETTTIINEYKDAFGISNHYLCEKISLPLKFDLEGTIKRREKNIYRYFVEENLMISLFSQIVFYPPLVFLDDNELNLVFNYYCKELKRIKSNFDNYSTLYTYIKMKCLKFVICNFYEPIDSNNESFQMNIRNSKMKWKKKLINGVRCYENYRSTF